MPIVLGVDGGGTKTHVVIMDGNGRLVSEGLGGPSNYNDVGVEQSRRNIGQAVAAARQAAGMDNAPFDAVFLGMASVVSPIDREVIRGIAEDLQLADLAHVDVDHDCRIALAGGLSGRPGIVQIAGTGSSTFGMNRAGEGWRAGGWGQIISDEGSSYWFGVQAMRAAVRAFDGRMAHTSLERRVMDYLHITHMNDIFQPLYVQGMARAEIAQMAPLVIGAARGGDAAAHALIDQGVGLMADCVAAVARRLGMAEGPLELALVGGLFRAGDIVIEPLRRAVTGRLPQCHLIPAELAPVLGAGILALRILDIELTDQALRALQGVSNAHL